MHKGLIPEVRQMGRSSICSHRVANHIFLVQNRNYVLRHVDGQQLTLGAFAISAAGQHRAARKMPLSQQLATLIASRHGLLKSKSLLPVFDHCVTRSYASASDELTIEVSIASALHCLNGCKTPATSSWLHGTQVRPYSAHRIEPPSTSVTTNKEELTKFFETMYKYRRMEIAADMMYKAKFIRGFCHL